MKLSLSGEGYQANERRNFDLLTGFVAMIYGVWLIYAAGVNYLLMVAILYAPGILFYWWARSVRGEKAFTAVEGILAAGLLIAASIAAYLMWTGAISAL